MARVIDLLPVHGACLIHATVEHADDRGETLRFRHTLANVTEPWKKWIAAQEPDELVVRSRRNVFRGMHIQDRRAPMWKYVRVTEGAIVCAVLDTRRERNGDLFAQMTLASHMPKTGPRQNVALWIPPWCAFGYWTPDGAEVTYRLWGPRIIEEERVIHHGSFGAWGAGLGMVNEIMSERDRNALPLSEVDTGW